MKKISKDPKIPVAYRFGRRILEILKKTAPLHGETDTWLLEQSILVLYGTEEERKAAEKLLDAKRATQKATATRLKKRRKSGEQEQCRLVKAGSLRCIFEALACNGAEC